MIKLVSKVELISQGRNGFEITGVDGLKLSNQNTISDKVIRTRSIPVPFNSRKLFVMDMNQKQKKFKRLTREKKI